MRTWLFAVAVIGILLAGVRWLCHSETYHKEVAAEVLTINDNIFDGHWTGAFLSSSSGQFQSDTIKVGVEIELYGYLFLLDLRLSVLPD
jgi:hypothetical protein